MRALTVSLKIMKIEKGVSNPSLDWQCEPPPRPTRGVLK